MSDTEMDYSKEQKLYKLVKNKLKEILLYIHSTEYALMSSSVTDKVVLNHLTIYNILRKKYNATYGVPSKKNKRIKFNRLYFNIIAELFATNDNLNNNNEFIKFTSLFC
jgi:hypothetical protein